MVRRLTPAFVILLASLVTFAPPAAKAQDWPAKGPIKIIVPFSAGSATDIIARTVFTQVGNQIKQTFVVENRGGAGTTLGSGIVARADADGYTLLVNSTSQVVVASTYAHLPYSVADDFVGISELADIPFVVATVTKYNTLADLIAAGKRPGSHILYGTAGAGSSGQLFMERLRLAAGFAATNVPFRGTPEGMNEVIAGRIDLYPAPVLNALPLAKAGKVHALAISATKRLALMPEGGRAVGSGGDAGPGWDFFVSYTQADRAWAEWIAWTLEEDGYRVLVQAWDFVPGSNWVQKMQDGVREAAPDGGGAVRGLPGDRCTGARSGRPRGRRTRPGPIASCCRSGSSRANGKGLLAGVVGIDLAGLDEAAALGRLRSKIRPRSAGRAKPQAAPGFPGPGARRAVPRARFPGGMPRVWKVPAQNPNFTGRGGEMAAVAAGLAAGPRVTVQSVHGLGGVGKTQLAAEYAYAHAGDYDLVWWVTADEPALIADQFAALATGLGLEPDPDPEAVRAQVHEALREAGDWLLVFDNADAVDGIRGWLPGGPRPAGVRGHVIITTRRGGFGSVGTVLDLDVIGTGDAVALAADPGTGPGPADRGADRRGAGVLAAGAGAGRRVHGPDPALPGGIPGAAAGPGGGDARPGPGRGPAGHDRDAVGPEPGKDHAGEPGRGPAAGYLRLPGSPARPAGPVHRPSRPAARAAGGGGRDRLAFTDTVAVIVDYSLAKRTAAGLQLHRLVQAAIRARHARQAVAGTAR